MAQSLTPDKELALDDPATVEADDVVRGRKSFFSYVRKDIKAIIGIILLFAIIFAAIFAPLISPYDPNAQDYEYLEPPSRQHIMGTDDLGRDLFTRIIYGGRISLSVGIITVVVAMILGVTMGLYGAFYGGWADNVIMRYIDLQWAFPNFIIAVYLVAVFGTGLSNVLIAITLAFLDDFARIVRGRVLSLREEEFVLAAKSLGASDRRVMVRHIFPSTTAPIIVLATISVSYAILAEAGLSFLGLGVDPTTPTWGLILANSRSFFSRAWWLAVFPGLAIMLTVLSINFLGDALRDYLDVRETTV